MPHQSVALRRMASKYLRLAQDTGDPGERAKFFDYAMLYAQLSEQSERREASGFVAGEEVERSHVSARRHVPE